MINLSKQKGFTLVEMIVSLAIFTIVALVAVGALVKVMDANKKSISLKTSINNLNFALESMTREMRVGRNDTCSGSLPMTLNKNNCEMNSGTWYLAFNSSKDGPSGSCKLIYIYKYDNNTIYKAEQTLCNVPIAESDFYPLISPDIIISNYILKTDNSDQPRVFLYIKGSSGVKEKYKTEFSLQTTISQRLPKI